MDKKFFFKYDICFCQNPEKCPNRSQCERVMSDEEREEVRDLKIRYSMADFFKEGKSCEHFVARI